MKTFTRIALLALMGTLAAGAHTLNTDKAESTPARQNAAASLANVSVQNAFYGWYYDNTLKSYTYWDGYWMYHEDGLGWIWAEGYDFYYEYGWLWDPTYGWMYTDAASFPYFYRWDDNTWYYYQDNSSNPRWFYNTWTGVWEYSYGA